MARVEWSLEAERELWAGLCSPNGLVDGTGKRYTDPDALWNFVNVAWGAHWYIQSTGAVSWLVARVHKPFLGWLQEQILAWKVSRRAGEVKLSLIGVVLPRGFGKTVTATKAAALWSHLDEPNMTTALGSEVHPKAKDFLKPLKEVMHGTNPYSWFTWIYGNWYNRDREWTIDKVEHGYRTMTGISEPSFDTFGTEKGITGYHPLMLIIDDPLSRTKLREGGGEWLKQVKTGFRAAFKAVSTNGLVMLVGTRYLIDDVIGEAFSRTKGYGIKSWDGLPCPYGDLSEHIGEGGWKVYFLQGRDKRDISRYEKGEPVLPEVWPHDRMEQEETIDSADFNAQIMNLPASGEHMPFERWQLESMRIKRADLPPIEYATIHCDLAYKSEKRRKVGDENIISVWLHPLARTGVVYFDGARRSITWRAEDFNDNLISVLRSLKGRMLRVRVITADRNPGGQGGLWSRSVAQAVEGAGLRVPEIVEMTRDKGKDDRLRLSAGFWAEGYVRLIEDAENRARLEEEMLNIGYIKPKDLSDASCDVWGDEKKGYDWYRKADYGMGLANDEGAYPIQPGDEFLRAFSRRPNEGEMKEMYDEQYPHLAPPEPMF